MMDYNERKNILKTYLCQIYILNIDIIGVLRTNPSTSDWKTTSSKMSADENRLQLFRFLQGDITFEEWQSYHEQMKKVRFYYHAGAT